MTVRNVRKNLGGSVGKKYASFPRKVAPWFRFLPDGRIRPLYVIFAHIILLSFLCTFMNSSRSQSSNFSQVVFPDTFDVIFDNDAEWFSLASSQSFAAGPLNFHYDTQNLGYGAELDDAEQNAS